MIDPVPKQLRNNTAGKREKGERLSSGGVVPSLSTAGAGDDLALLPTKAAAARLWLKRPLFSALVTLLNLPACERSTPHGGSAHKHYDPAMLDVVADFLAACRREGGPAVLRRAVGGGR
jgi:hypothetical protein